MHRGCRLQRRSPLPGLLLLLQPPASPPCPACRVYRQRRVCAAAAGGALPASPARPIHLLRRRAPAVVAVLQRAAPGARRWQCGGGACAPQARAPVKLSALLRHGCTTRLPCCCLPLVSYLITRLVHPPPHPTTPTPTPTPPHHHHPTTPPHQTHATPTPGAPQRRRPGQLHRLLPAGRGGAAVDKDLPAAGTCCWPAGEQGPPLFHQRDGSVLWAGTAVWQSRLLGPPSDKAIRTQRHVYHITPPPTTTTPCSRHMHLRTRKGGAWLTLRKECR